MAPPLRRSFLVWLKARKAFAITIALVFAVFAGALIHSRSELKRVRTAAPGRAPLVYSDDPFVLSNGYRVSRLYKEGADGQTYEFRDRESLEAWERQQPRKADDEEDSTCSICSGTGRSRATSAPRCTSCAGGGTKLTPSGHRMICNGCEGTGFARHDPNCIYCQGTGRVGLPGQ